MGKPCNHDYYVDGCRLCFLAQTNPQYQKLWGVEHKSNTKLNITATTPDTLAAIARAQKPKVALGKPQKKL